MHYMIAVSLEMSDEPLCYLCIPYECIGGYRDQKHDIENCCSFLYICLWLFKYTNCSAVFFFLTILSLEMSDEPNSLTTAAL